MVNPDVAVHIEGADARIHQLHYCQPKPALVPGTVSVDGMHSQMVGPVAAIVHNSHPGADWRCPVRDEW